MSPSSPALERTAPPPRPAAARPRIVAILPRGEAIRNFVYGGALDEVARSADLTLLTVLPGDSLRASLAARFPDLRELREHPERWPVRFLREILDMAHGRWLWSEAAQERWRLRDAGAGSTAGRLKRAGKKALALPFAHRPGLRLLSGLERGASRLFRTTREYLDLFRRLRPSLVFNGSHIHSRVAIQAVQAAQWLKIPTAAFLFSWDNLTSQGRIVPAYDSYLVWNEAIRDHLLALYPGARRERTFVTGTPQFDFHFRPQHHWTREEFCRRVGADPARPVVLYSTGMPNHMPGEPDLVEQIADMLPGLPGSPRMLVRVYPKDRTGRFEPLKRRRTDILFPDIPWEEAWLTPKEEDIPLLTSTLRHCALGINVASTISLELCMFDRPAINVGYNPPGVTELEYARYYRFDHYRPVVASGAVQVAGSPGELRRLLLEALENPGARREERRRLLQSMFGSTLDGRSGSRVAAALLDLAR